MPTGQPDSSSRLADIGYEPYPERLVRQAMERGEFDHLPGEGQPLPGAGIPDDPLWWVRSFVERNRIRPYRSPRSSS